jgi:phage recombination protein Bet
MNQETKISKEVAKKDTALMPTKRKSILAKFADRYSVDPEKLNESLRQVAFRQKEGIVINDAQMIALLIVADQYNLNPFTKEIYAYPDKNGGIVPVVGIDGWTRIINEHPQFKGMELNYSDEIVEIDGAKKCYNWIECVIYRKDKDFPTVIREHLDECYRPAFEKKGTDYKISGAWQSNTKRMLRHKAIIQAGRVAFSFSGIHDEDEARRIVDNQFEVVSNSKQVPSMPKLKQVSELPIEELKPEENKNLPTQAELDAIAAAQEKV